MTSPLVISKRPGFLEGVVVALVASMAISISLSVFDWVLPLGMLARVVISVSGLAYLLYLFSRSKEKIGRLTTLAIYVLVVISSWIYMPSIPWFGITHLGLIWLVRSLYFYSSILSALLDLGLTALAVIAAIAAYLHTGSLFLALWCLFLGNAMFAWIPVNWQSHAGNKKSGTSPDGFDVAYQSAENAVRKLAMNAGNH